ncbi:MAG: metallophosphoesterase [Phycisphaerales bacterium]|nr:metallophosphoesterase [Phycisphaerales bacterium]
MSTGATDLNNPEATVELFTSAGQAMHEAAHRSGSIVRLPRHGRLLVSGDLHDHLDHWYRIQHLAKLPESPEHHVVVQELIHGDRLLNGMDFSYRMLARVAELVLAHPDQVHVVLGNHELSQLTRRAVSKGAGNSVALFQDAVDWVYGDDAQAVTEAIETFIAAMPLAVRTESGLLCTHSLPAVDRMGAFEPEILERPLRPADYEGSGSSIYMLTWGRRHEDTQLDMLAKRWGVTTFCIGHQSVPEGIRQDGPRLVAINSDRANGMVIDWPLDRDPSPEALLKAAVHLQSVSITEGGGS